LSGKTDQNKETPVVTSQPVNIIPLQDHPITLKCPNCHEEIVTKIKYRNGMLTYAACTVNIQLIIKLIIFHFVYLRCFCGCCLIPFCVKACKDVDHKCPECSHHIGTYRTLQEKYMK
ncbi:lipopolysaccharide-induced tumor necrosis factor-alpha factor, partial [Schistosoma bovis]